MKILNEENGRIVRCEDCDTKIQYEEEDIKYGEFGIPYLKCPVCNKNINLDNEEDLKLVENISEHKTFTITTSDTITTITDGTHTTTINRYYTDKHDDMIALEEVVKKYKSEMEEIERAEKMPKVGDKVKVADSGETYDINKYFLIENKDKINIETIIKWESGELPEKDNVYKVVFKKDNKFIVEDDNSSYIMNAKGLKVIK